MCAWHSLFGHLVHPISTFRSSVSSELSLLRNHQASRSALLTYARTLLDQMHPQIGIVFVRGPQGVLVTECKAQQPAANAGVGKEDIVQ